MVIANTPMAVREIPGLHPINCWSAGGMDARLRAWSLAAAGNYDYSLWLDDDEVWYADHVSTVVDALRHHEAAQVSYSAAKYGSIVLPREHSTVRCVMPENLPPKPGNTVSSTLCIRRGVALDLMLEVWCEHRKAVYAQPEIRLPNEDATFLRACAARHIPTVFVPRITVTKRTQQNRPLP
jgi:hypothetical protein